MTTTTPDHFNSVARKRLIALTRPLAALGLLLATAGAAQAQAVSFAAVATYSTGAGTQPNDVAAADVNGDGKLDLLTPNYAGTVSVLLGTGSGTFQTAKAYSVGTGTATDIAVGDVNVDGKLDVLTANQSNGTINVLLGNGNGTFQTATSYATNGSSDYRLALGDVNADGKLDVVTANVSSNTASVLLGNGNGTFQTATTYATGSAPINVALADVNADGKPDIVTANIGANAIGVLLGNGNGTFQASVGYSTGGGPEGLAVADLNADGKPDVIAGNFTASTAAVLLNNGNGTFQPAVAYPTGGTAPASLVVADVNGDGKSDLLAGNFNSSTVGALLGNGNGTFQAATTYSAGGSSTFVGAADVNADGKPDLLTANRSSDNVGVLLNTTVFTPTLTSLSPTSGTAGTSVTLTGTNLTGATAVSFNGTAATFTVVNATTLTATVPAGATSGNVTVTTPGGTSNGAAFTVVAPVTLTTASPLPGSTVGVAYSQTFQATGGSGTYTFTLAAGSVLPPGFTLATTGALAGQPTGGGSFTFTIQATDKSAAPGPYSGTKQYSLTIAAPTITVAPATLPSGTAGTAYSQTLTASNGTAPYTYALVAGTLPTGLTLASNGTISGTPTTSGSFNFTVRATDSSIGTGPYSGDRAYSLVIASAPVASNVTVQYQTGDFGQPTDNQLRPFLQLVNSGTTAVPYSSLTIRYWLTAENFKGQLVTPIDWAKLGTGFVSARYVALATPRRGALGYIEYSFAAGAGNLAAGTDSGPIYGKAYKPDYSNFNETDDWSYQTSSSFTTNDHVTVYQNGTLIGGTEPPAVATTTNIRVLAGNQDISTSTSYINVTLQVANAGNRPVNYSDLTARYYFTRDGATTIVPTVDYAKLGASNISVRYVPLSTPLNGADGYLEIGFSAALGVFYPLTNTDNIQFKIRKGDYTAFTQTNDYSFSPSSAVVEQPRVPAYLNGVRVFGTEPSGVPASTARSSQQASASAVAASSTAAVGDPLAVSLTGSPNPFTDHLNLQFSLAYTQTYSLALYDGQGRLVRELPGGTAEAGQPQQLTLPAGELAAGLYLVRLTTATDRQQLKFIKQ